MNKIIERESSEIIVPQISMENIQTIEAGTSYLNDLFPSIKSDYDNRIKSLYEKTEKEIRKTKGKGLSRVFSPFMGPHYIIDNKDTPYFKGKPEEKEIRNSVIPYSIRKFPHINIERDITKIQDNLGLFLRYLFPTPVNRSAGEKNGEKVIPTEESFLFGMYRHSVPFTSSWHENFAQMSENMQLIGTVLPDESINYFVAEIENSVSEFNSDVSMLAETIRNIGIDEIKEDKKLNVDVGIANHALNELKVSNGAQKGLYAILLNTSLTRIKPEVSERFKKIENQISRINNHDCTFRDFLSNEGYKAKNDIHGDIKSMRKKIS